LADLDDYINILCESTVKDDYVISILTKLNIPIYNININNLDSLDFMDMIFGEVIKKASNLYLLKNVHVEEKIINTVQRIEIVSEYKEEKKIVVESLIDGYLGPDELKLEHADILHVNHISFRKKLANRIVNNIVSSSIQDPQLLNEGNNFDLEINSFLRNFQTNNRNLQNNKIYENLLAENIKER
jgi:hypothetical protein